MATWWQEDARDIVVTHLPEPNSLGDKYPKVSFRPTPLVTCVAMMTLVIAGCVYTLQYLVQNNGPLPHGGHSGVRNNMSLFCL